MDAAEDEPFPRQFSPMSSNTTTSPPPMFNDGAVVGTGSYATLPLTESRRQTRLTITYCMG